MKTKKQNQQPNNDDVNLQIRLRFSPKLKELIIVATQVGKVGIKIGKFIMPLLLAGSIALKQVAPPFQLPPESTQQDK